MHTTGQGNERRVDCPRTGRLFQKDDAGEDVGRDQTDPRHTCTICPPDELWGFSVARHEEKCSRGYIEGTVPSRDDTNHDQSVN
jgi:hypothetical protein